MSYSRAAKQWTLSIHEINHPQIQRCLLMLAAMSYLVSPEAYSGLGLVTHTIGLRRPQMPIEVTRSYFQFADTKSGLTRSST